MIFVQLELAHVVHKRVSNIDTSIRVVNGCIMIDPTNVCLFLSVMD